MKSFLAILILIACASMAHAHGAAQAFCGRAQQVQAPIYYAQQPQVQFIQGGYVPQQPQIVVLNQNQGRRRNRGGLLFGGGNAANVTDSLGNTFVNLALIRALSR
jgi:hypothetical protein